MKKIQIILFVMFTLTLQMNAQSSGGGNLYFRFDGPSIDVKQRYLNTPSTATQAYQDVYWYLYPCLLGLSMDPSLKTIDRTVFTTVPVSQLSQYDVMTIQDFCQRCAATGSQQAQEVWLKPYLYNYPNYKIFVVHINHANQTAKIVQVKWTAWD